MAVRHAGHKTAGTTAYVPAADLEAASKFPHDGSLHKSYSASAGAVAAASRAPASYFQQSSLGVGQQPLRPAEGPIDALIIVAEFLAVNRVGGGPAAVLVGRARGERPCSCACAATRAQMRLSAVVKKFDLDRDGWLRAGDVRAMLQWMRPSLTPKQLKRCVLQVGPLLGTAGCTRLQSAPVRHGGPAGQAGPLPKRAHQAAVSAAARRR